MGDSLKDRFISASFRFKKVDACFPTECTIPIGEWVVMEQIVEGCVCSSKHMKVSEIKTCIPLSKPAVSQILNSLEKKGYIIRNIDRTDRRKIAVTTTPEGTAILNETRTSYDEVLMEIVNQFGKEEMINLIEYLNRLVDIYEQVIQNRETK
ncbi:MAG TPA: MarR family transcriptional regulator [Candidatus Merdenecus merdavium]|nr:MarR family transcriptional regulator [Candidatus Merdenecus merdavium]